MKPFDQDVVSRRFRQLPESVQDVGLSDTLATTLTQSLFDAGLTGECALGCNRQITLVLVGLSKVEECEQYLRTELGLDQDKANALISALHAGVFGPMREALVASLAQKKTTDTPATPSASNDPEKSNTPTPTVASTTEKIDPYREHTT